MVTWFAGAGKLRLKRSPLRFLGSPAARKAFAGAAAAEFVADKLPGIPARTRPALLVARAVSGGLCGAAVCAANKRPVAAGALLGVAGAVGGAYAGYALRRKLSRKMPDRAVAAMEDAITVGAGAAALSAL